MINRNNKKGFTIVELVIVIAVIAILAAVLIPTFSGIIRKANISADTQLVKNMNTALAADENVNGKPDSFSDVIAIVKDAGYILSCFNPTTEGCYVAWDKSTNQLLLIDGNEEFNVIYSVKEPGASNNWYFAVSTEEGKTALKEQYGDSVKIEMSVSTATNLTELLSNGGTQEICFDDSVVVNSSNLLIFDVAGANTTINLGNATLNTSGILPSETGIVPIEVKQGNVTLNGGYISTAGEARNAHDLEIAIALRTKKGTTVNFNDNVFENTNTTGQIKIGGTSTMNNVTINSTKYGVETFFNGQLTLKNSTINAKGYGICVWACNYDHSSFEGSGKHTGSSLVTIESGNYNRVESSDKGAALHACGGDILVTGGTFTAVDEKYFSFGTASDVDDDVATITIKGGTFGGVTFDKLTVGKIQEFCKGDCNVVKDGNSFVITAK